MNGPDRPLPRPLAILVPVLIAGVVLAFYWCMARGMVLAAVLVALLPLAALLFSRLNTVFALLIVLAGADLYIPGFASELTLLDFFGLALLLILAFYASFTGKARPAGQALHPILILLFFAVMGLTIAVRGFGFRQLGGGKIGGMSYVRLFTVLGLYLVAGPVYLTPRQWRLALLSYCFVALLPAVADMTYVFSGGKFFQLYQVVKPSPTVLSTLDVLRSGQGILRLKRLPGVDVVLLSLLLFRWRGPGKMPIILLTFLGIFLAGLTGFRLRLISIMLFVGVFVFVSAKNRRILTVVKFVGAVLALLLVAAIFASRLPVAVNRAMSWIPFLDVSREAEISAYGTTAWRLRLWQQMIDIAPHYLLVGRGFAFSPYDLSEVMPFVGIDRYDLAVALATHNYHNGPLGLLLDLGVAGLVVGMLVLIIPAFGVYRATREPWHDQRLALCYRLLLAKFAALLAVFVLIYGDTRLMPREMLLLLLFLERLRASDTRLAEAQASIAGDAATGKPKP